VSASDFENPVLAFSLKGGSEMESYLETGAAVWINLLNSSQTEIAQHFSKRRVVEGDLLESGSKKISVIGAIGQFETEVVSKVVISQSVFFFCEVSNVELKNMELRPLTYTMRKFNG
jgi:flavin reductase (DIM6/NTAB) family NADH-FMN oxidoreductase RutF